MDIVILVLLSAFLVKKLYDIIGSEDGFIVETKVVEKITEVSEAEIVKNNEEDNQIVKELDHDSLLLVNEIKHLSPAFGLKKFITATKDFGRLVISAISDKNVDSVKNLVSDDMFERLKSVSESLNNRISIMSFDKIKIDSIKKFENIYYIELNIEMMQHLSDKDANVSSLEVSEKWTFQKLSSDKSNKWILANIVDNS